MRRPPKTRPKASQRRVPCPMCDREFKIIDLPEHLKVFHDVIDRTLWGYRCACGKHGGTRQIGMHIAYQKCPTGHLIGGLIMRSAK